MKTIPFALSVLVLSFFSAIKSTEAQNSDFKLSDYSNPHYFYQTLDLNFVLNSGLSAYNTKSTDKYGASNFSVNSNAGATYSLYTNSPRTQTELKSTLNGGLGTAVNHSYFEDNNSDHKAVNFNHFEDLSIEGLKRFYNSRQYYFEVSGMISGGNNSASEDFTAKHSDTIYDQYTANEKHFNFNTNASFLIGKGRIEQVQDARLAMYLLEDLQKLNRQKQVASNEDILALAAEITRLKYKRFFDYRLRKIAEITVIDSFFQRKGIRGIADATYYTSLNDNWSYSNNPVRQSGKRFYTGIEADFRYTYYNYHTTSDNNGENPLRKQKNAGALLVAGFSYEKPVSLRWQNSANFKIGAGITSHSISLKNSEQSLENHYYLKALPSIVLAADYGFGYYPNSRTWLTFKWWLTSEWNKEKDGSSQDDLKDLQNDFTMNTGPRCQAYYYLSEKLRLSLNFAGSFSLNNIKNTYDVPDVYPDKYKSALWNHELIAGLSYSLF